MMEKLRRLVPDEFFDYQLLMNVLRNLKKPRNKVTKLLALGDIIRVKKGLYIFGENWSRQPVSLETLANLIYGPSYISKEYALSFYGMIPEKVECVTSMTTGKTKLFETPLGYFHYQHLIQEKYVVGVDYRQLDSKHSVYMATPEKALSDHISKQYDVKTKDELYAYLIENMRIDESCLNDLKRNRVAEIASVYKNLRIDNLLKIIEG